MIHMDPKAVWQDLEEKYKDNPNVLRKNGLIINVGNNTTKEEKQERRKDNKLKYELPREEWAKIELPSAPPEELEKVEKGKVWVVCVCVRESNVSREHWCV